VQPATVAGVAASEMSDIVRGELAKFRADRLETVIPNIGADVKSCLTPLPQEEIITNATTKPAQWGTPARCGRLNVELVTA